MYPASTRRYSGLRACPVVNPNPATARVRNDIDCNQGTMKQNVWEFVRKENGSYTVFNNGKLLSDAIPKERWEDEFCVRFGFCGHEYEEIVRQLRQSGKCTLKL